MKMKLILLFPPPSSACCYFFIVFVCLLCCLAVHSTNASSTPRPNYNDVSEISYVVEPFESIDDGWFSRLYNDGGYLNLTILEPLHAREEGEEDEDIGFDRDEHREDEKPLFGDGALRIDYEVQSTETWGGFVDFGWIMDKTSYNCYGATHLSIYYNVLKPQSLNGRVHLRLILLDDSDCLPDDDDDSDCAEAPGQALENYYTFHYVLDDTEPGWKELRMELRGDGNSDSPFYRTGWTGKLGNDILDPDHIRGWRIELSMDSQAALDATSNGSLLLDQLACVGGGDMLGAAFHYNKDQNETFKDLVGNGVWHDRYYESPFSENLTKVSLDDNGTLHVAYAIEQTETWGGFVDYEHLAPGAAYYNLSSATALSLNYRVEQPLSSPGRAHLRIIMMDNSDCIEDCAEYPGQNLENYYSFHYVLDEVTDEGPRTTKVDLRGDSNPSSPFYRPGWTGKVGNDKLDASNLKGYRFEFNVDSQGGVGSFVEGSVSFSNWTAVLGSEIDPSGSIARCTYDKNLLFKLDSDQLYNFKRIEFMSGGCCDVCEGDPDCLYGGTNGVDCFLSPGLEEADLVALSNTDFLQSTHTAFITSNPSKRGDFCQLCDCEGKSRSIDCRGRQLKIVPSTFSPDKTSGAWMPRVLDLRDNPDLVVIDSGALEIIAKELEELWLPKNLRHLSFESIEGLPTLSAVHFEGEGSSSHISPNNVITDSSGFYGDVCCDHGRSITNLSAPAMGLTFCDMKVHVPGIDTVYEPFKHHIHAKPVEKYRPSSSFMAEAAESVEKCAEYCTIDSKCKYFSYDARWKESEHKCYMLEDSGKETTTECCQPDDYADPNQTLPGWTIGRPPRTRHVVDNARVLLSPRGLVLNKANGFSSSYSISLGSTPLRGAVWVEPKILSSTMENLVSISPSQVALYNNSTAARINVSVVNADALSTGLNLIISNRIQSCDIAFTSTTPEKLAELSSVSIDVVPEENYTYISSALKITGIVYVALQGVFSVFLMIWTIYYRNRAVVKRSQPVFLALVILGCFMISLSIIPTVIQGEYRYEQDPYTGQESDTLSKNVHLLDAACMGFVWLFNLGFTVTFSALFAKVWRIRKILTCARSMIRTTVLAKDVAFVMVAFTSVHFAFMLVWQLVDPLMWTRDVIKANEGGYPLESVGYCTCDYPIAWLVPMSSYIFGCLIYALYLCYVTRDYPSEVNEAKWITASIISIFEILLVAVPVLVIAWDDASAFFFVRSSVAFLLSMGVTCEIFLPKFIHLHFKKDVDKHDWRRQSTKGTSGGLQVSGLTGGAIEQASQPFRLPTNSPMNQAGHSADNSGSSGIPRNPINIFDNSASGDGSGKMKSSIPSPDGSEDINMREGTAPENPRDLHDDATAQDNGASFSSMNASFSLGLGIKEVNGSCKARSGEEEVNPLQLHDETTVAADATDKDNGTSLSSKNASYSLELGINEVHGSCEAGSEEEVNPSKEANI